jgi:hypothetical protein
MLSCRRERNWTRVCSAVRGNRPVLLGHRRAVLGLCRLSACLYAAVVTLSSSRTQAAPDPAAPAPSAAQPAAPPAPSAETKKKAMEHFETGLRLYEDGDFSLALIEFERAHSYISDYRVLYNIGQVSIQLGRYARASLALEQYLKEGGADLSPARISSVKEDLKMLDGRTARLQVSSNVEGAEVLLDDALLAKTPTNGPILVDAGEHRLTLQKTGYVSRTERLVLAGRDENRLHIDLEEVQKPITAVPPATAVPAPVVSQAPKLAEPAQAMSHRTQLLYVGAGATGLLVIGWAVTGYVGIKAASDLHDALQRPTTQGELDSLKGRAKGWLLASDILGTASLAAGAATLYFTLKGPAKEQPRANVTLGLGLGAVRVAGTFE